MSRRGRRGPDPVFDGEPGPVLLRTVFERFPITIKGAFVLRGGDANPHVARIAAAAVVRLPRGSAKPVDIGAEPMDVAPGLDLFLPFEATIADLDPGWYAVRADLQVDGGKPIEIDSKPFSIPWSRAAMATGSVSPGWRAALGPGALVVDRVDLRSDRVEVQWHVEEWSGAEPALALSADGRQLDSLPGRAASAALAPGRRRSVWYPAPRGTRSLSIEVSARSSPHQRLDIPLP